MDWADVLEKMDALFPDTKIQTEVRELLANWEYRLEWDETETFLIPRDVELYVRRKSLIRDPGVRGGGYFMVQVLLGPVDERMPTYTVGALDIMYDFQGEWMDEFFRRDKDLLRRGT